MKDAPPTWGTRHTGSVGSSPTPVLETARRKVLDQFCWNGGHADVWRLFSDGGGLSAVVAGLAEPWRERGVTRVSGIEARGFLLGGAVAIRLGVGFVAVRKAEGVFPGPKVEVVAEPDYRGRTQILRLRRDSINEQDRVLLVDDWAERGSQAGAVRDLIRTCGADFLGLSVMVDQLDPVVRSGLGSVTALVGYADLPPSLPDDASLDE